MINKQKLFGRMYRNAGVVAEGEEYTWPTIPVQIMSLLEDVGIFQTMTTKHPSFEDGMVNLGFVLPDAVVYALALGSLAYAILQVY